MSYGAFVHYSKQERAAETERRIADARSRRAKATVFVAEKLPDLAGCPFAAYAALMESARLGRKPSAAEVRRRRAAHKLPSGETLGEYEKKEKAA